MSDTMSENLLEVRNIRKSFRVPHAGKNKLCALDGITLDLKRGETLGLVGESGCGKSTLARTLMMLERPDEEPSASTALTRSASRAPTC